MLCAGEKWKLNTEYDCEQKFKVSYFIEDINVKYYLKSVTINVRRE
jgi:hypothetical protein